MNRPTAWLLICAGVACGALGALVGAYRAVDRTLGKVRW